MNRKTYFNLNYYLEATRSMYTDYDKTDCHLWFEILSYKLWKTLKINKKGKIEYVIETLN